MSARRVATIMAALAATLLASVGPAEATFPGANGKIAFYSNRAGSYDIFAANPDGSGLVNLTATPAADEVDPAWSPDGQRLAYTRDGAIWVMNANGSGQTQLTGGSAADQSDSGPAWSPDGTEIVLARSDSITGDQGLWVIPADGGAARRLTTGADKSPSWSPDGRTIAFERHPPQLAARLALVAADGTGEAQIVDTGHSSSDAHPSWSPDGTTIAIDVNGGEGIQIVRPDGTVVGFAGFGAHPEWSPDGSAIAYNSCFGNCEIEWRALDGSASGNPSGGDPAADRAATWQPVAAGPQLSVADAPTVAEGDAGTVAATLEVSLSAPSSTPVTIDFATADGTATGGSDYQTAAGTVTFNPGQTQQTIGVLVNGDTLSEPDETFEVRLSNATNATIADGSAVVTIRNDDLTTLSAADASAVEGDTGTASAFFTLTLSSAAGTNITVDVATQDGTATSASDYVATSSSVAFNPGETTKTFAVPLRADTQPEPDETFTLLLTNATGATIADGQALGTILDDDTFPVLSAGFTQVTEGDSGTLAATIGIGLSAPSTQTVTVEYATVDGSAKAPGDYVPTSGTLTFAPGETTKTITALVKGDGVHETPEGFGVTLSNPTSAKLRPGFETGSILILDDDPNVGALSREVDGAGNPTGTLLYTELIPTSDDITVSSPSPGVIRVRNAAGDIDACTGPESGPCCVTDGSNQIDCHGSKIVVQAGALDDKVQVLGSIPSTLRGGAGADSLTGGSAVDVLDGGGDDDVLDGGGDNDTLAGGSDDDSLTGGTGTDSVKETTPGSMVLTNSSLTGLGADTLTGIENAVLTSSGGSGPATLDATGFTGTTLLEGMAGDTLRGGSGNDRLDLSAGQPGSALLALASGGPGSNSIQNAAVVEETADDDFVVTKLPNGARRITGTGAKGIVDDLFQFAVVPTPPTLKLTGGPSGNTLDAWTYDEPVEFDGAGGGDTLRGSRRSDLLKGGPGSDRIEAWNDDFAQDIDTIACGSEFDYVATDALDTINSDCEDTTWVGHNNGVVTPGGMPLQVLVLTPAIANPPATVHIAAATQAATAWSFLGYEVNITAPPATTANPIQITFTIEGSLLPANVTAATLQIFRNGVLVGPCTGPAGQAIPTPCVSDRQTVGTSAKVTVLTAAASAWTFGAPLTTRGVVAGALQTSNGIAAALLAGSDGKKLAGTLAFGSYRSTNAVALAVSGRKAWLAGLGTDGRPFLAYLEDNGSKGRGDVFRLWIAGVEQTTDGRLAKGDLAVAG